MRQPNPTQGMQEVDSVVKKLFVEMADEATARGLESYPGPLMTFNGRDANADALEEMVDAFKYLTQARMEKERITLYIELLRNAVKQDVPHMVQTMTELLCETMGVSYDN